MDIGERIKAIRKQKKLTQEDIANALGVQRSAISKYEKGMVSPSWETIEKIAKALEVSPFDLMLGGISQAGLDVLNGAADNLHESMIELIEIGKESAEELKRETKLNTLLSTFVELNDEGQTKVINYAVDIAPMYRKDNNDSE